MSESIGELLTDDPLVSQCEGSSDPLASEGAAIFHDRHLSYMEGMIPVHTSCGDCSSCSQRQLTGQRNMTKQTRTGNVMK